MSSRMSAAQLQQAAPTNHLDRLTRERMEQDLNIHEWGRWMGGGWPNLRDGGGRVPNISDEDALKLDTLVRALPTIPKMVIIEMYIYRKNILELEHEMHCSNRVVASYRDQALNQLHGAMFLGRPVLKSC